MKFLQVDAIVQAFDLSDVVVVEGGPSEILETLEIGEFAQMLVVQI